MAKVTLCEGGLLPMGTATLVQVLLLGRRIVAVGGAASLSLDGSELPTAADALFPLPGWRVATLLLWQV